MQNVGRRQDPRQKICFFFHMNTVCLCADLNALGRLSAMRKNKLQRKFFFILAKKILPWDQQVCTSFPVILFKYVFYHYLHY